MSYKYSFKTEEPHAKALGVALPISTKHSIEICDHVRHKKVNVAKTVLESSANLDRPIPFKKFTGDVGHKRGMMSGRYAVKACSEILNLLKSAEANAVSKGMNTDDLIIKHISAQRGPNVGRFGRQRGRRAKRTHVEVVLVEKKAKKKSGDKK